MYVKFKQREKTEAMRVVKRDLQGKNQRQLYRQARKIGDLDTGFHIIVSSVGLVEYDRDIKAVAGHRLPFNDTSLYVLVDCPTKIVNDAQHNTLARLSIEYGLPIIYNSEV